MSKARHSLLARCCPDIFNFDSDFKINENEMMEDINYPFSSREFPTGVKNQSMMPDQMDSKQSKYSIANQQM